MTRKRTYVHALEFERVKQLLLSEWDPISFGTIKVPDDEYDSYVGPILAMLRSEADSRRIADYLLHVEADLIGLTPNKERALSVARMLEIMFESRNS